MFAEAVAWLYMLKYSAMYIILMKSRIYMSTHQKVPLMATFIYVNITQKQLKLHLHWLIQVVLNILCNFSQKQLEVGWNINTCPKLITNMNFLSAINQQEVCFQTSA